MGKRDHRIDAYIAKAADFAKPILVEIRERVHQACPDVEETIKWSMPHFDYHGTLCRMAAFKAHCAFGFWKGELVTGSSRAEQDAMGQMGRIGTISDLPSKAKMAAMLRKAMQLNIDGVAAPHIAERKAKAPLPVPDDLAAGLKKTPKAKAAFEAFTPGKRREYIEWIIEAKTEATRAKRLTMALEWIAEGKARNWKYEKC